MEQKAKKDYGNGKIYMIRCNKTQLIYIGSTTKQYLSQRMGAHVRSYKSWTNGKTSYCGSYEIIKNGDYVILLIESHPCKSSDELRMREQYHIDLNKGCMNKNRAYTTVEHKLEQMKEWYEAHKEERAEYDKEYYQVNKKTIAEQQKAYNEANKEAILERTKEWYEANKEAILERKKEWYEANKEAILERNKEYNETNKEAISEYKKAKITCTCGAIISKRNKSRHIKSNKHLPLADIQ